MTRRALCLPLVALGASTALAGTPAEPPKSTAAAADVRAAEQGFADAFARRDREAFASYVAADAVFMGAGQPLRGKEAILEVWTGRYFEGDRPPFSWRPERVAVGVAGALAVSTGPVFDPEGVWIGAFVSTWRREEDGRWRVVLDAAPRCHAPRETEEPGSSAPEG